MENNSFIQSIVASAKGVITNPVAFYRQMPKSGGFTDPVIFVAIMAAVTGLVVALLSFFGATVASGMAVGLGAIVILPVFALIGSFIGAAVMFVVWKLMGSNQSYETAYRCVAYASAVYPITALISFFPYVGSIVGMVWGVYLMIIASQEVHGIAARTAYLVLGVLGAVGLLFNLSSEMAARSVSSKFEGIAERMEEMNKNGEMTPEEAGKAFGEFLKGVDKATREAQ